MLMCLLTSVQYFTKSLQLDEDDYADDRLGAEAFTKVEDGESTANATQKAVDMTTDWIVERLSANVVAKLVMISLVSGISVCFFLTAPFLSTLSHPKCPLRSNRATLRSTKLAVRYTCFRCHH